MTFALYSDGLITIRDSRISIEAFRGLYLRATFSGQTAYIPVEYALIATLASDPNVSGTSPTPVISDGLLGIIDPEQVLLGAAVGLVIGGGEDVYLVVALET